MSSKKKPKDWSAFLPKLDTFSRVDTIENHRRMWRWIATETKARKQIVRKDAYMQEVSEYPSLLENECWLCEYTGQNDCNICPLKWDKNNNGCMQGKSLYKKWIRATNWENAAEYAQQIAELEEKEDSLIPPLTFRMYQTIRFNRPVDKDSDIISPGGYEIQVLDDNLKETTVNFDFEDYEGHVDKDDPCVVHVKQKNPDYNAFEDLKILTEHMLRNIIKVNEWFIYTGELNENKENPLIPVDIKGVAFEIIHDSSRKDMPIIKFPMRIPIILNEMM